MTRRPRTKEDHLVTMTLMSQCYGYIGWTQFWGALFSYYVVANDFGFPPSELQYKANENLVAPNANDIYNPTAWNFGNTNLNANSCQNDSIMIDWIFTQHAHIDLRMAALNCRMVNEKPIYTQIINFG